jgi:hypothetical protein
MPYNVAKYGYKPRGDGSARNVAQTQFGADLKVGLTSNVTLDGAINPDFGQVEADPGVLNLSAFEQFFAERRPFFLEGSGIFRYDIDCKTGSYRAVLLAAHRSCPAAAQQLRRRRIPAADVH